MWLFTWPIAVTLALGEAIEEHWNGPVGGMLMGVFCWLRAGAVYFYELMVIEPEGDTLVFRFKHFNPGMKSWEEKDEAVTVDLVSLSADEAIFLRRNADNPQWITARQTEAKTLWLIYRKVDDNSMVVYFEGEEKTPTPDDMFRYIRKQDIERESKA